MSRFARRPICKWVQNRASLTFMRSMILLLALCLAVGRLEGLSRFDIRNWPNQKGAVPDAKLMSDVLVRPKFWFHADNVHLFLQNEATHHAILSPRTRNYLVDDPAAGDTVVFYYAGHRSLRFNSQSEKKLKAPG